MEHPKIEVLFICDFNCCHSNPIIKKCLSLFLEAKLQEIANIGLILASNVNVTSNSESAPRICPLSQISGKSVQK